MAWFVFMLVAWWLLPSPAASQPSPVTLRFHHLHYRAADPLTAMRTVASSGPAAQPTILQGLGVGVRVSAPGARPEYVLFDRLASEPGQAQAALAAALPVPRLIDWLASKGVPVSADVTRIRDLSERLTGETFDHIGLAASSFPDVLDRLSRAGVRLSGKTDDSAFTDSGPAGLRVEIVRDPDLPDAFWCPMHPDVRSPAAGACPICRMALVPIPAPQIGEYRMDVALLAGHRGPGASGLRLTLGYPDSSTGRTAVPALLTVHDKRLHLFIIGTNLDYFAHVHPDQRSDGVFELRQDLPAGEYMVIADFLPAGGTPQMVQRAVVTPGYHWPSGTTAEPPRPSSMTIAEGVRATLATPPLVVGQLATMRMTLEDVATHKPISDLEPYLSAPAHALLASADLTHVTHVHPREQETFGPTMSFDVLPAVAGPYKIWVQVQRRGRVLTFPFVLDVGK